MSQQNSCNKCAIGDDDEKFVATHAIDGAGRIGRQSAESGKDGPIHTNTQKVMWCSVDLVWPGLDGLSLFEEYVISVKFRLF